MYNLGDYRRKIQPKYAGNDIFSPDNKEGNALRERVCNEGLADLLHWLEHEDGEVELVLILHSDSTIANLNYYFSLLSIHSGCRV